MRCLFVVAHPDDEVLGAGAFIRKITRCSENEVDVIILNATYEKTRQDQLNELVKSHQIIGVGKRRLCSYTNMNFFREDQRDMVETIEDEMRVFQPDYIFTHFPEDVHSDHKIASIVTQQASRLWQRNSSGHRVSGLYFMEVPSSTNWSNSCFKPDTYVEVGVDDMVYKIDALKVYTNVLRPSPHPRCEDAIMALAKVRGVEIGYDYAEAFMTCWRNNI